MLRASLVLKATRLAKDPVALDVFCDWLEGSLLFGEDEWLSLPEVVEFLVEEALCTSQTEGWLVVSDATLHLRARQRLLGRGYPFSIEDTRLVRKFTWQLIPAYAFCLFISIRRIYPDLFNEEFGSDFNEQGELFEILTTRALERILSNWMVYPVGWKQGAPTTIVSLVERVSELVGEPTGDTHRWIKASAKDGGLDILCFRRFSDGRGGIPIYLVQCASGLNWESKLTSPDLNTWSNLIQFTARPRRAFATPLGFVDEDFSMYAGRVQGLFLDRYRLLEPLRSSRAWLPRDLSRRFTRWTGERVPRLPWE